MSALLQIRDEFFGARTAPCGAVAPLRLASAQVSAREIIHQRVITEVEELNARFTNDSKKRPRTRSFIVDIQTDSPEARLNRPLMPLHNQPKVLEVDTETERAIAAFARQRFVMLFDNRHVEGLDEELIVTPGSEVVFLHLTPLRGG